MKKVEQRRMLNSFRFSFVPAASLAGVHLPLEEIALTSSAQIRKLEVVVEELDKRLDRRDPEWDVSCESCWQTGWEGRGFHQRSSLSGFEQLWLFLMAAKKEPQRWIFQAMSTFAPPIVIFQVKTCFFVYNIIWAYIDGIITDLAPINFWLGWTQSIPIFCYDNITGECILTKFGRGSSRPLFSTWWGLWLLVQRSTRKISWPLSICWLPWWDISSPNWSCPPTWRFKLRSWK